MATYLLQKNKGKVYLDFAEIVTSQLQIIIIKERRKPASDNTFTTHATSSLVPPTLRFSHSRAIVSVQQTHSNCITHLFEQTQVGYNGKRIFLK